MGYNRRSRRRTRSGRPPFIQRNANDDESRQEHEPGFRFLQTADGRRGDGQQVRLGNDAARLRAARRAGDRARVARRLGPPHARPAVPLRSRGRGPRSRTDHRRRRRRGPPAGDAGGDHDPAGARRAGRKQDAQGGRFAALDRPDAARGAGRHAGHRRVGRGERGAACRGDPRPQASRRSARPWRSSGRPRPTPWENRPYERLDGIGS